MIKKMMSVLVSMVMLCSCGILASASTSGSMFGTNTNINAPGSLDAPAANIFNDYIASLNISETNKTIVNGETSSIKTSSQPLYLGDIMYNTKSTFTEDQLPNVLSSGEVNGDDGKDYEYNLKIDIPNSITKYGEPENDLDKAVIYSDFSDDKYYNLRIIFPTAVDVKELAGEVITLFGKDYAFSEDEDDLSNESITLFEKSNSVNINNGETKYIDGHNIKVDIEDGDSATLYVDGISKNVNDNDWSGKINGVDIYVKNIFASNVDGGSRYIQISLNSEKLVLTNGDEVSRGTSTIDGTNVEIKKSGDKVREIVIKVTPNNIELDDGDNLEYVGLGESFIDPVFKTIKFGLDNINPGLTSDDRDYIKLKKSGEKGAVIEFTNKAGKDYNFNFIDDGKYNLLMSDIHEDEYFITASNEYTQIWKIEDIKTDEIKLRDQGSSSDTITLSLASGVGNTAELPLADGSSATITRSSDSDKVDISKTQNFVYTKNGAKITLNFSFVNITEETQYNGGTFKSNTGAELGKTINIEIDNPDGDLGLDLTGEYEYKYSDDDDEYIVTTYGTYLEGYKDESLKIYYPEEAMSINFNIGEVNYQISTEPIQGNVSKIILGGSCINQAAADLLGIGRLCGVDFTNATGVGIDKVMIKTFAESDGKIAILVAGYETADTLRGVNYLKTNPTEFNSVGVSKII